MWCEDDHSTSSAKTLTASQQDRNNSFFSSLLRIGAKIYTGIVSTILTALPFSAALPKQTFSLFSQYGFQGAGDVWQADMMLQFFGLVCFLMGYRVKGEYVQAWQTEVRISRREESQELGGFVHWDGPNMTWRLQVKLNACCGEAHMVKHGV